MALPDPEPGLVISYAYLWRHEQRQGRDEGRKDRPCVIVLAVRAKEGGRVNVTVAPVTHTPPVADDEAIELPEAVKASLGLDGDRSWVVVAEVNQFDWPGFDLRPLRRRGARIDFGFVPPRLYDRIVAAILRRAAAGRVAHVNRD